MASSPKYVCLFFLLSTLLFSLQTHARDSQFFSKVTRNREATTGATTTTTTTTTTNDNVQESQVPNVDHQEDEQPTFIPQTTQTGYGLYGHETGLDPPTTITTTDTPATTTAAAGATPLYSMDTNKYSNDQNEKNYATELKGLSDTTSYASNVSPTKYTTANNYYKNNGDDQGKFNYEGAGYYGGVEKQGMSDTRFLENGKYFHDISSEKKLYEPNNYNYMPYNKNYNNDVNGYYGNNRENHYEEFYNNNNNNFYNNGNAMEGYQNQLQDEDEFDFDP